MHQPVTHLGRGFSAHLRLEDQSVSRRHAVIVDVEDGMRILDDRSANGTFVNDRRVTEAALHDRDVIRLGRVVLVYATSRVSGALIQPDGSLGPTFGS